MWCRHPAYDRSPTARARRQAGIGDLLPGLESLPAMFAVFRAAGLVLVNGHWADRFAFWSADPDCTPVAGRRPIQSPGQSRYTAAAWRGLIGGSCGLNGRTLLVTGAAGSLGSALSGLSLEAGFNTIMLDRDQRALEALYDRACEAGLPEPVLHPLDLATAGTEQFEELVGAIADEFGPLDGLVHCAAHFAGLTPLEHVSPPDWLQHMQVNLNAAWLLSVHCLPLLRKSRGGQLYFVLEDLELVGGPLWGPYGVSKHALRAMVGQLAAECESSGVRVLGINPGPFRSSLRSQAYLAENPATQPPPDDAAAGIIRLLTGETRTTGAFVDLVHSDGANQR